jgi:very-short-patch-repair endonuclease
MTTHPDLELAELVATQHGVFMLSQAIELRFSRNARAHRIVQGRWEQMYLGVYRIHGVPASWKGSLLAACWAGGGSGTASHRSAAALWDLPGRRTDLQEIICRRWRRNKHDGLIVHETSPLRPSDITEVDGIPVTTVEHTLMALGAVCSPTVVELALDAALRRELTTLDSVTCLVRELGRQGRNGVGVLRAVLDLRDSSTAVPESVMETRLKQLLRRHGLPEPVFQFEIRHDGQFVARVDAAYPDQRIAIEYESYEHHTGRLALVRDSTRRNALVAIGWQTISVTGEDIRLGGDRVVAHLRAAQRRAS